MTTKVDKNTCIGCGTCVAIAEKTFKLDDNYKAEVIDQKGDSDELIKDAMESCPVNAISMEE